MDFAVALTAFLLILPAELPDKTFVATLVLATRYRPLPVWAGVSAAFLVQCLVAVLAGGAISLLPRRPVLAVTCALFAVGSFILFRGASKADEQTDDDESGDMDADGAATPPLKAAIASFGVLFAAEWGDLSQLLTAGLTARYRDPLSVFVGSWVALVIVAGVAVVVGRTLTRFVRLSIVRRVAGGLFAVLAVLTGLEALGVSLTG